MITATPPSPRPPRAPRAARARPAFTLIEAVLACLIVGVALVPAIGMLGAIASDARSHADLVRGMALARQLMGEITQCRYSDPDTEAGETRATWDDVSDYNGFSESPPATADGTVLSSYAGWSRSVSVVWVNPASPDSVSATDLGLKRINITVTSPAGKVYTLSALRCSTSEREKTSTTAATYTSSVTIDLQGASGDSASATVPLPNQVP